MFKIICNSRHWTYNDQLIFDFAEKAQQYLKKKIKHVCSNVEMNY